MPEIGYALSSEEHRAIYPHQIGPDQEGFFKFAQREILPRFAPVAAR